MLPGGVAAAAFLFSLIPGWWFLRRTESSRRPRDLSALQEVLELVGVGLLTTGLTVVLGLLIRPQLVLRHKWPANTAGEIRLDVALVLGTIFIATLLAEVAARVTRRLDPAPDSEVNIGVWWAILRPEKVPVGQLAYVALSLKDGDTVEGVLDTYTWAPDVAHRDIALKGTIKFTQPVAGRLWRRPSSVTKTTPYDRLVVPEAQIKHVALKYINR